MRKVNRPQGSIPEILHSEVTRTAKAALAKHYRLPDEERARRRAELNPKIWTSDRVRDALWQVFSTKCAYCETHLDHSHGGDIAHHRPTGSAVGLASRSDDPNASSSDYYNWFAYEWDNLFPSCLDCNRSKRNIFPVNGPRARLRCTWTEAEINEQSLVINPCRIEPRKHLYFWFDGRVKGLDELGATTINVLALDRPELVHARVKKLDQCLGALVEVRGERNFEFFRSELLDDAPYCGAARIAFFHLLTAFAGMVQVPKPSFRNIVDDAIRIVLAASEQQLKNLAELANSGPPLDEFRPARLDVADISERYVVGPPRTSQLKRIRISNFKGIAQLDLEIPSHQGEHGAPCMMLLGENSTGKSTALQAMALALMGQKMRLRMGVSPEDFIPREMSGWQLEDTVTPEVTLEFDTGEPIRLQVDPLTKRFIGEDHPSVVLFSFGSRRFFGREMVRRQATSPVRSLFDPFAKLQHPGRWIQTLARDEFDALARAMREVLVLQEDDKIGRDVAGRLFVRAHGRDTPLEGLSDGYRSLMAMVLDIMRGMIDKWGDLENARGLVLIDEIETHLHPRWKLRVMSALRRAMPNVQFIATTHDPLCLRGMRGGEVQVFVRDEQDQVALLTGLPDVRGLRAEQLLTSDYFGLASTADPEVESALERLAIPGPSTDLRRSSDHGALRSFQWLGDTPFEQIVNEALKRFVDEGVATRQIDRGRVREAAVNDLLMRLRALHAERSS